MKLVIIICSVFALLSLHLFMYGCNLFMWKSTRINYNFIFEFQPNTALRYRDAFLICTTFMTAVVGAMVIHLILRASGFSPSHVDTIPGILLLVHQLLHLLILYHKFSNFRCSFQLYLSTNYNCIQSHFPDLHLYAYLSI